jgi:hypothetical protein
VAAGTLRFRAKMLIRIGNPYVMISAARARAIRSGWRKPMPVLVRINGKPTPPWRINLMPIGDDRFYLYLHGDVRKASATRVGDMVDVEVRFDPQYRSGPMHPMPAWFRGPLEANPKARNAWDMLIPSRQKEILRYLSWLKSEEARERNVAKAIRVLSGSKERYMARSWSEGR